MRTLGKLKLNQFSKAELDRRALNALRGGCCVGCACGCTDRNGVYSGDSLYDTAGKYDASYGQF